jgi:benzoyl-CoA-dihydrodiol lyase
MAVATRAAVVDFERHPATYRHWKLEIDGPVATLRLAVDPEGGLRDDYDLKLNSYDVSVDIELRDAVERLRFEHPEVRAVVLTGGLEKVFCAGANIQMLAGATHHHKVNFCKLTNETRNAIEEASARSGQRWLAAINGTAAGGGYELALACDEIVLVDDRSSSVSLPEVPLLAVLPGTGGLTRVVDKRGVRRDLADVFATKAEGVRGQQAVEWGLVDEVVPPSRFDDRVRERALALAARSDRPSDGPGVELTPLRRTASTTSAISTDGVVYDGGLVEMAIDRELRAAHVTVRTGDAPPPTTAADVHEQGDRCWPLGVARALDDVLLHLRFNEPEVATIVLHTAGDAGFVQQVDSLLDAHADDWLIREIVLLWGRTLKRLDLTAKTIVALAEPGSCFTGTLAELLLAADRSFLLYGAMEGDDRPPPVVSLGPTNLGRYPMSNGLSRLATRFHGQPAARAAAEACVGRPLDAAAAADLGLVTFTPDDIDWEEEIRLALEERASFSPDALTGLEANLRFPGPETMETKIFARLTAWQNWIFQRPNAAGPDGALRRYGTGSRPSYDRART